MRTYGPTRGRYPDAEDWRQRGDGRRGYQRDFGRDRPPVGPDDLLLAAVRQKLFEDTWLDARHIQVEAEDGVIYLSGTVSSHLESRYAWDDAWETDGVRGVVSRLEVEETSRHGGGGGRQSS